MRRQTMLTPRVPRPRKRVPFHARPGRVATAVLFVLLFAPASHAQVLYGSLTGDVTDATGAVLPGATVLATNVGTGVVKQTITDQRGGFVFSDLLPGVYDVSFELAGFNRIVQRAVRIET